MQFTITFYLTWKQRTNRAYKIRLALKKIFFDLFSLFKYFLKYSGFSFGFWAPLAPSKYANF